ncbi:MAG: hypothetical protein DRN04_10005 [Thermoprotei archaeon]|nr:MAG: hypothetical protein DRN04_10005 [Thermoprotei archaeon]
MKRIDKEKISEKVANLIYEFIFSKVERKEDILDLIVEVKFLDDQNLDVDVYLEVNPFSGIDPKKLIEEAIEESLRKAESLLKESKDES